MLRLLILGLLLSLPLQAQTITWTDKLPVGAPDSRGWIGLKCRPSTQTCYTFTEGGDVNHIYGNSLFSYVAATNIITKLFDSGSTGTDTCNRAPDTIGPHDTHPYQQFAIIDAAGTMLKSSGACQQLADFENYLFNIAAGTWTDEGDETVPAQVVSGAMDYDTTNSVYVMVRAGVSSNVMEYAGAGQWNIVTLSGDNINDGLLGGHDAKFCPGKTWIVGGYEAGDTAIDPAPTYSYDAATDTVAAHATLSGGIEYPAISCDSARDRLLVHAGANTDYTFGPLSGTPAWTTLTTVGTGPTMTINGTTFCDWDGVQVICVESQGQGVALKFWAGVIPTAIYPPIAQ